MYTGSSGSPTTRRTHTYDIYGRPSTTTVRVDNVDATFTSTYDLDGRIYTVNYPSGFTARYEYTSNQRYLSVLRDHTRGAALWTTNTRDAELRYTQGMLGNGVQVNRGFNTLTRRLNTVQAGPSNLVANFGFGYDTVGNLTGRADYTQGVTETFQYDNLNRLTRATIGATTKIVTYNAVGNILTKTQLGSSSNNTYNYPAAGNAKPYAVSSVTGVVNGVTNPSYTYDNNGNMASAPGRTITWTSFNKVQDITQTLPAAANVSYVYDAEQQRIKQTSGSTTVKYYNDPASGVSAELNTGAGGTWHDVLFAEGQRVGARIRTTSPAVTTWQYYIQDHQGSVAVVTDASGNVVQRLAYDAWGRRRNPNGTEDPGGSITAPTSRGYTDHEHLPGISLINMNGRVYYPELGKVMSPDPFIPNLFNSQALNRYSYVYNNPVTHTDPSGYCTLDNPCDWEGISWDYGNWQSPDMMNWQDPTSYNWWGPNGLGRIRVTVSGSPTTPSSTPPVGPPSDPVVVTPELPPVTPEVTQPGVPQANDPWVSTAQTSVRAYAPLQDTRPTGVGFWGRAGAFAGVLGSGIEVGLGVAACYTGVGCLLGGPAIAHGADNFQAELRTLWTGQRVDSMSVQLLEAAGVPPAGAHIINEVVGATLTGGAGAVANAAKAGSVAAATAGREIKLLDGFYEVEGSAFKFSKYYYEKLWATGRGAPFLQADEVLATARSITPDRMPGFYRFANDSMEMVYNPTTKEVWHLMPIGK